LVGRCVRLEGILYVLALAFYFVAAACSAFWPRALVPWHLELSPRHAMLGGTGLDFGADCLLSDYCGHALWVRRRD
jgi:hypothetical protein